MPLSDAVAGVQRSLDNVNARMVESNLFIAPLSGRAFDPLTLEERACSMAYCGYVVTLLSLQPEPRRRDLRT